MPESAYIHIPFCKSKCKYCSFVSFNKPELMQEYVSALIKEITCHYSGEKLKTLYFGGGTPSLLPLDLVLKIISQFKFEPDCEITFEVNPDDADFAYFKTLKDTGINRLSIGSQTFDDKLLKLIGRRHGAADIINAVNLAKKAGFENISLDLIYGLPTQTIEALKKDLEEFLKLDIQHISTYGLKIEEDSFWGQNTPTLPNDDEQADMYEVVNKFLEANGFFRYEVSNFAKKEFESRHNLNYWDNNEYYGLGAAAHGYVNGVRYSNFRTLEEYMNTPCLHEDSHMLTEQEKLEEEIFLGFRKASGIDTKRIQEKFGVDFEKKYADILKKYSDCFEKTSAGYALNLKGMLISTVILSEFI